MGIQVRGDGHTVAGRDIIQLVGNRHEPLTDNQRRSLNALVTEISEDLNVEPRTLWIDVVHLHLGVKSVQEVSREQFAQAVQALNTHRDQHHAVLVDKRLISTILRQREQKGITEEVSAFCLLHFGESHLKSLNRQQLLELIAFVDQHGATAIAEQQEATAAPRQPEPVAAGPIQPPASETPTVTARRGYNRWEYLTVACIFLTGVAVGQFIS